VKELIKGAVQQRKIVLFISLLVLLLGAYSYNVLPKQENPHIKVTGAIITTVYPGASPEDVEQLVTKKIEDAVSEIKDYKDVSSESGKNVSVVVVGYNDDADIETANRELREKIDEVKGWLPGGCLQPEINTDPAESAGLLISLSGNNYTYEQLSPYAEEVEDIIGRIDGIYKTELVGNVDKQVTVNVDTDRLNQYGLSLREVGNMLSAQNLELPGGALENEQGKLFVGTRAFYQSIDDIRNTIVGVSAQTGAAVRLKDIAFVDLELKDDAEKCRQGEKNAVIIAGYFQEDRNIIPIGKEVREALEKVKRNLPPDLLLTEVTFQPEDVAGSIGDFAANLIMGIVLVVVAVFFGMGFRNAVVVSLAIPFTVMATFILMNVTGVTLQSVSLTGLIVALGMIVDNAVVVSDAVEVEYAAGESKEEAAVKATSSTAMPVFMSTLTTVAAFVPLLFIPGKVGSFLDSLPKAVIYTLSASFLAAVFVTPALLSMVIKRKEHQKTEEGKIKKAYLGLLQWALKRRRITAVLALVFFLLTALFVLPQLKVAFFPKADKDIMYIDTYTEKIGDLEYTEKIASRINRLVSQEPEVLNVTTGIGTSLPKFYQIMIPLPDKENFTRAIVKFDLRDSARFKTKNELAFYLQEKLDAHIAGAVSTVKMLEITDPASASVEIRVSGKDLQRLKEVSGQLEDALKDTPGTVNVDSNAVENTYEYLVDVDTDKASMMGLLNADIQQDLQIALLGSNSAVFRKAGQEYDIKVKSNIRSLHELENLAVKSSITDKKVLLKQVAQIKAEPQLESIKRYNKERSVFVTSDVRPGYSPLDIAGYIEHEKLPEMNLEGVEVIFEGEREQISEKFSILGVLGIFILLIVYSILLLEFKALTEPLIILLTIPLSLIGSILALWLFGKPLSFTALLGVISLMGIVVNNGILLIDYIKHAREQGFSSEDACFKAVGLRFRPIMLTAATTLMGLLPLAASNSELFSPMAVALMGGLLTATLFTMIVIPVIYLSLDNLKQKLSRLKKSYSTEGCKNRQGF